MTMSGTVSQILVPKFKEDCLLSKGIEVKDLLEIRKETVLYVKPCTSERGKLMADIELTKDPDSLFMDPKTLCSLLEIHRRRFAEMRCSEKLGVAKLRWGGREISIFKNGKLKIQQAIDRDEIMRIANSMSRLIWGSAICGVCGQPTINCASGKCGKCASHEKVTVQLAGLPNSELLQQGYASLENIDDSTPEYSDIKLRKARYLALHFVMDAPSKENAALGLVLLGETDRVETRLKPKP